MPYPIPEPQIKAVEQVLQEVLERSSAPIDSYYRVFAETLLEAAYEADQPSLDDEFESVGQSLGILSKPINPARWEGSE